MKDKSQGQRGRKINNSNWEIDMFRFENICSKNKINNTVEFVSQMQQRRWLKPSILTTAKKNKKQKTKLILHWKSDNRSSLEWITLLHFFLVTDSHCSLKTFCPIVATFNYLDLLYKTDDNGNGGNLSQGDHHMNWANAVITTADYWPPPLSSFFFRHHLCWLILQF